MKLYYFGYGANKDFEMMKAINGRSLKGRPAYIEGFELCVQQLNNIPKLPQKILRKAWGDYFESYVIREGRGRVHGTLWEINPKDRKHISEWELIPDGWYIDIKVTAILDNGKNVQAVTDAVKNQPIARIVNGAQYKIYLMEAEQMWEHAKQSRS